MTNTPNIGIPYVPENTLDPAAGLNLALNFIDAVLQTAVISMDETVPPMTAADGALYIVGAGATGAWAGQDRNLARFVDEGNLWQFFVAGEEVRYVINLEDDGFYKFVDGSPGSWVLAAGLSDAPSDGEVYGRRDGLWEALLGLTVSDEESPQTVEPDVTQLVFANAILEVLAGGVVRVTIPPPAPAPVITEPGVSRTALASHAGDYTRFTNAATKTYLIGDDTYDVGDEFHGRNVGAGALTITEATGFTVNPPAGGTLVIPQGGTFTVKVVAADEADLFGVTEDA